MIYTVLLMLNTWLRFLRTVRVKRKAYLQFFRISFYRIFDCMYRNLAMPKCRSCLPC